MAFQLTGTKFKAWSDSGAPLVGGLLHTYASGTTTPKATYTDATLGSANTNPIVLDARGEADVWLGSGAYTFDLKTEAGVTIDTVDGVVDPQAEAKDYTDALRSDLSSPASGNGAAIPAYQRTATGARVRSSFDKHEEFATVLDFTGVDPTGSTTSDTAFINAIAWAQANDTKIIVPPGLFRLNNEVGVAMSDALNVGKGIIIEGQGPGSRILVNHTGKGFRTYAPAPTDSRARFVMRNLTFLGGAGAYSGTVPEAFIYNDFAVNSVYDKLLFMTVGVSNAAIVNETGYGASYDKLVFRGVTGDALKLMQNAAETNYSFINRLDSCDFGFVTGKCVNAEGTNGLMVLGGTMEQSGYGIYVDPTVNGVQGANILVMGTWFEKNTTADLELKSSSSYWCEASVKRCQFGVFSLAFQAHINLGVKSRVIVEGYPLGNTVVVTGSASAGFVGVGTANFTQSGTFAWTELNTLGVLNTPYQNNDASGNIVAKQGAFITSKGTATLPTGVATTMFTMPSATDAVYEISTHAGTSGPAAWTVVAVIACSNSLGSITVLKTSTNLALSLSGLNVQGLQSVAASVDVSWSVTRKK